jgi:hypothetical protein
VADADIYVGKDVDVEIWDETETTQYAVTEAQEVRVEPAQEIEGVDALGSDEIQKWAPGLRTYEGSLSQLMVSKTDQLDLLAPFQSSLTEYVLKLIHDTGTAGQKITIKLTGVIFPSGAITSPKNEKVILEMPFRAKSATVTQT